MKDAGAARRPLEVAMHTTKRIARLLAAGVTTMLLLSACTPEQLDVYQKVTGDQLDAGRTGALLALDPNYRPRLWDAEAFRAALLPLLRQTDILLMGHEDARAAFGVDDEDAMLAAGAALGAKVVVLKRAERGAMALVEGRRYEAPAEPVAQAIDPVGAGDGFDAGFLAGWLRGWGAEASLRLGATVGAASVQALGDYAGYPKDER